MQSLNSLIGKEVSITLLRSEESSYTVTLHGVEQGGIWIESREIEKLMGHDAKKRSKVAPTEKPVFFIPFSSLFFLIASSVEIDERTLQGM